MKINQNNNLNAVRVDVRRGQEVCQDRVLDVRHRQRVLQRRLDRRKSPLEKSREKTNDASNVVA